MTKTAQHSLLFRLWIHIRGLLAFAIILFGIVVGLVSLILPNEELYKQQVVDFLSRQWKKPVEIESISGKWKGLGPKFIINGLNIKDKDEVLIQQVTLDVNLIKYLIPQGSTGITIGINDIEVDFERKASGKIVVSNNLPNKESFSDKLEKLLSTGTLSINQMTLNLSDSINQQSYKINSKITVQQTKNERAFAIELFSKELADNIVIKAITDKSYDFSKQAQWYMQVDNLSLSNLGQLIEKSYFPKALVDAQIWFSTEKGNIVKMSAQVDLHDKLFNLVSADNDISGKAELIYQGDKHLWQAQLSIKDIQTASLSQEKIIIQLKREEDYITLTADVLDTALLKAIMQVLGVSGDTFKNIDLTGKITDIAIKYDVNLRRIVDADIAFQGLDLVAKFGEFTSLSGNISLHDEQIRLLVDSDSGTAIFPDLVRGKVEWDKLLLTAQTSMHDDYVDVKINSVWCDCQDFVLDGSARIAYDEELQLDLAFAVYDVQVNQLYKYWPSFKWKAKALNFLDQALVSGVVDRGMILYHGLEKEFPFDNQEGIFLTKSNLQSGTIKYHKDWPRVTALNAVVDTLNLKLLVESTGGEVLEGKVNHVIAVINDLKNPLLTVAIDAEGEDNFLLGILKQSPMKKGLEVLKQDINLSGFQQVAVDLKIPLKNPNTLVVPTGTIKFNHTDFQIGNFNLLDLDGELDFQGVSLFLNNLKAKFLNQTVVVSGDIIHKSNQAAQLDVRMNGNYGIENFESTLDFALPAKGNSAWFYSIVSDDSKQIIFTAYSDLLGVELDVPEPFVKTALQKTPISISCILPCIDTGWDLKFNNMLDSHFTPDKDSGEIQLNKVVFGNTSSENVGNFGGNIDVVDVDKWIELVSKNFKRKNTQELPFKNMSVHVNKLIFMARELKDVDIDIQAGEDGLIFIVNANEIAGKITIPTNINTKGIIVQLDKLHWIGVKQEQQIKQDEALQISSNYPALHIWIGDLIYDGIPLGEATIEVRPVVEGVRVEKFNTRSDLMNLTINGVWLRDEGKTGLSKFNIIMTSRNIAKFLTTMGFQAPITQAETIIDMQAQWSDFPSQFEIKNISGNMRIEVGDGEVIDAKPGMGRVLGLFSLTNLPRRLILDFRDVLGKGLRFESMKGDFVLKNGEAYTDSFVIDSSSVKIIVAGKTGLANQDYDQMVYVTPRVGRVLPTIGAIAGGAVGAAAGFLVQGMFHKGLKNVGKIIYKVTGTWDDPIIELIETQRKSPEKNKKSNHN